MATFNTYSQVNTPPIERKIPSSTLADASELKSCLAKQSVLPSDADLAQRGAALDLLKEIILHGGSTETRGHPIFAVVPIGSYGLGVCDKTSTIDCLCVGHTSPKTFFVLAIQRLRKAAPRGVKILGADEFFGTVLELQVNDIIMSLRYCRLPPTSNAETWPAIETLTLSPDDPIFSIPPSVCLNIKLFSDLWFIRRTIPDPVGFRLAHHFIKCWARRRGIYAAKLGYLSGIQISILLSVVCKQLPIMPEFPSVPTILATFYNHYAAFDWGNNIVFDPAFHRQLKYVRARQPMVILGFHGLGLNTAQVASVPTVRVISDEFKRANSLLSSVGMTWSRFLGQGTDATEFLNTYSTYIKVTAQFWDISLAKGKSFLDWLESRFTVVFTGLCKRASHVNQRMWPARSVQQKDGEDEKHELEDLSEENAEYEGCYLVGLDTKSLTKEEVTTLLEYVQAVLYNFENQVRSDTKHFDPKFFWVSAETLPQSSIGKLRVDGRDWRKHTTEAEDDDLGDSEFWASLEAEEGPPSTPAPKKKRATRPPPGGVPAPAAKLRRAGDVLARLLWDQAIDSSDYIVGYEDRFSGVKERAVNSWKSETTHEEFIPEHRIVYFKRKSDGAVVWDKETRRDTMFGSGLGSG
ncbi:hypothetical protein Hte_000548 [Hypoxylon texense]